MQLQTLIQDLKQIIHLKTVLEISKYRAGRRGKALASGTKPTVEYSADRAGNVLNQYFGYEAAATTSYAEFTNPLKGKTLNGATVSMWVNRQNDDAWDALWSFFDTDNSDGADGRLFFTPNTYLGYNGTVGGTWQCLTATRQKSR